MIHTFPTSINRFVESRLAGVRKTLIAAYEAGREMSSASKGIEREAFVKGFLSRVFSPAYRFGTGDITDAAGAVSGQIDVVIESPFWYSLPMQETGARLYMAEGVGAVVEVKSDLAGQWGEVRATVKKVKALRRRYRRHHLEEFERIFQVFLRIVQKKGGDSEEASKEAEDLRGVLAGLKEEMNKLPDIRQDIPCYAVGFTGWKKPDTILRHFQSLPELDGLVILDANLGCFRAPEKPGGLLQGDWVLGIFLDLISTEIAEIAKMEMPQTGNYSMALVHDILTNPLETLRRIEDRQGESRSQKMKRSKK